MNLQTIDSQDMSISKLFDDFYVVPSFQREYVWGQEQVEQLLQDIYNEYDANHTKGDSEYFIGSIVVCGDDGAPFDLIDGQQRVTTVYLLLCAIRDHIQEYAPDQMINALAQQIAALDVDENGADVFRYRVSLLYDDSCGVLEEIAEHPGSYTEIDRRTRSIDNIVGAYETIRQFLRAELSEIKELRRFYSYLTKKVKLIRVKTASVAHALKVFETINDRGIGLDSMDLLKNLMFMQADARQFDRLKDCWKELVDLLFREKEKPLRFLRYFIFSQYKVDRLKEDEIYRWFCDNADLCGYNEDSVGFVGQLIEAAKAYTNFLKGVDVDGSPNRYLRNIRFMSGAARQHLILLLAGRHLSPDDRLELSRQIENLFFTFVITREPTREFERRFAAWAPNLQDVRDRVGLDAFIETNITKAKRALGERFRSALSNLSEWDIQKYRMKYVLAKLTQYIDELAQGSSGAAADLGTYINNKVTVEHVLPQLPNDAVIDAFDKPSDQIGGYIYKLGNLTLLESSLNSSAGNKLFSDKRVAFRQSNFLLTKTLGGEVQVGSNTAIDRAVALLERFGSWNSGDIERRQDMLVRLAHETWDVPVPEAHGSE